MGVPPQTLNIELSYDPEIPFLDTCSEKNMIQKDTYNPVFIAALFPKAKKETHRLRKQTSGDRWEGIVRVWDGHVYIAIFKMDNPQGHIV